MQTRGASASDSCYSQRLAPHQVRSQVEAARAAHLQLAVVPQWRTTNGSRYETPAVPLCRQVAPLAPRHARWTPKDAPEACRPAEYAEGVAQGPRQEETPAARSGRLFCGHSSARCSLPRGQYDYTISLSTIVVSTVAGIAARKIVPTRKSQTPTVWKLALRSLCLVFSRTAAS